MCWSAWWWRTDEEEHKMKKTTSTGAILSYCLRQCLGDDYDGVLHLIYDSTRQTQCSPVTGNSHKQQPLIMYVWWGFGAVRLARLIEFCFQMQFSTTMHTNHYWWNLICICICICWYHTWIPLGWLAKLLDVSYIDCKCKFNEMVCRYWLG